MRAVVTRVKNASVVINEKVNGAIDQGLLVLLGVGPNDTEAQAVKLADKVCGLRIFEDENGKMNLSVKDVGGEILVISQFTLCGDCRKGRRPSWAKAAPPAFANEMYEKFISAIEKEGVRTAHGTFQAYMAVDIQNDGPVTLMIDTKE